MFVVIPLPLFPSLVPLSQYPPTPEQMQLAVRNSPRPLSVALTSSPQQPTSPPPSSSSPLSPSSSYVKPTITSPAGNGRANGRPETSGTENLGDLPVSFYCSSFPQVGYSVFSKMVWELPRTRALHRPSQMPQ